jgi:2-oxoisovalerate dehydrogenase E1 component
LQDTWSLKDPVDNFEQFLLQENVYAASELETIKEDLRKHIKAELKIADSEPAIIPNEETELNDMFAPFEHVTHLPSKQTKNIRFIDSLTEGLREAMYKFDNLVLMGQDIGDYGGVFKVTDGFVDLFGKPRVRNTPLCESAIVGAALGLSINGMKAMMEMQFADFVTCGFNQIINNLAKIHYRWGQNADVVVRMPTGGGTGAGPFHSQSNEAWFFHTPGLKIAYPAFPADAKGLLLESFEDPNPVLFFEHKALYRSISGDVPEGHYTIPFGKANIVNEGTDLTIITYGMGVHWALKAANDLPDIKMEILDLRTLAPLDTDAIYVAAKKNGKVIVLHEDNFTGGVGAEIAALITENCFEALDAPVKRCASMDTAIPFAVDIEKQYMANRKLVDAVHELMAY